MTTLINTRNLRMSRPGFLAALGMRFAQYRVYRNTLDELSSLSDRELNDLGISKLNLRSIAYQAAYGS